MRLGRFERKIVAAMATVAFVPLAGTLLLGQQVLSEAYGVGVNQKVGEQLDRQLELYRTHFATLREGAERTALAVSQDYRLCQALEERSAALAAREGASEEPASEAWAAGLPASRGPGADIAEALGEVMARYPTVSELRVSAGDGAEFRRRRADGSPPPGGQRTLSLSEPMACDGAQVEVVLTASEQLFADYQRAGELVEVYSALEASSRYVSNTFLTVYIACLLSVILVALGVGIVLSRRVTRRVAVLADATKRVGRGNLDVEVPGAADDEVGELTRAFNSMVRDLKESGERIDYLSRIGAWQEFARRLAHEIKNPLTPIQLAVQETHRTYRGDDPRYQATLDEACAIVEEEIATLRRLVGEFSAFARLPQVTLTDSDLGEFVEDAVHLPALEEDLDLSAHGIEVRLIPPAGPVAVRIDAMMLKRCVDNLVRNAVQALRDDPGRSYGLVTVAARREDTFAVVEVRDDGPGIDAAARARVFDPYYTTKQEGTGLGLAIVKKIVLEHAGTIECLPASEGGACFRIRLPLVRGAGRG